MSTPVWTWPAGSAEPVLAAHLETNPGGGRFRYESAYRQMPGARALDPMHLRFTASGSPLPTQTSSGLPGVIVDAMPSGYGEDRLKARHGRDLSALELLELGPDDAAGAISVCQDIGAKMA